MCAKAGTVLFRYKPCQSSLYLQSRTSFLILVSALEQQFFSRDLAFTIVMGIHVYIERDIYVCSKKKPKP